MSIGKWISAAVMIVLLIALGAYREIIFVNINEQILFAQGAITEYRVLDTFAFLNDYSIEGLGTLKWVLTISFTLAFLLLSILSFRYILKDRKAVIWILWSYLVVFILAGISFVLGKAFGMDQLGYTLSRVFMGALQSPFILMLMIPARMLAKRS